MRSLLKPFLATHNITQAEVARGIGRSTAYVSVLAQGRTGASQRTSADLLRFLSKRIGRAVSYEELFAPEAKARKGAA
jgi:transcriptional regulator with XRE-family HTH domain